MRKIVAMLRGFTKLLFLFLFFCGLSACQPSRTTDEKPIRIRLAAEPDGLNPILARNGYSRQLIEQIFQPLLQFNPQSLDLQPVLAEAVPQVEQLRSGPYSGGVAYTYVIRQEARWDNDTPVLASDYLFTLKCIFNPKIPNALRGYLDFVKDVKIDAENPRKFTIYADEIYFLAETVCSNIEVYPEYVYDPEGLMQNIALVDLTDQSRLLQLENDQRIEKFAQQFQESRFAHQAEMISGSGPYHLTEWLPGQRLVLQKKEKWWASEMNEPMLMANAERLEYLIVPDEAAAISLLREEKLDVLPNISARQFVELQNDEALQKNYQWLTASQLLYYYIVLNEKNPKLEDRQVRRALAHLVDIDTIVGQLLYGFAKPTIGPVPGERKYYNHNLSPPAFQPDTARRMLEAAGWGDANGNGIFDKMLNGERVELSLQLDVAVTNELAKQTGLLLQENARKAGVDLQIVAMDFSQLSERLKGRTFEMSYSARGNPPGDPDLYQSWHSASDGAGGTNYSGFGTAESDAIIDSIRSSLDPEERARGYLRLQEIIQEEQPAIFLFVPQRLLVIHRRFEAEVSARWPGYFPERFVLKRVQ